MENLIGASEEAMTKATGEVAKDFAPLDAGVYKGVVKAIQLYTNNFDDKSMRYVITVKNAECEERDVQFTNDISAKLKDKSDNMGYANRFKMFQYATNVADADLGKKAGEGQLNSFGKKYDFEEITGMTGKPCTVLLKLRNDTTKAEGASFKYSNTIAGVLATDGTDASGEDKATEFDDKVKTTPVENYEGYVKGAAATTTASTEQKAAAESEDF